MSDASVLEGNSGTRSMVFTITRGGDTAAARVRYATAAGGSATAATDYTAVSGSVALAAGQATATFAVPVRGDTLVEPEETIAVSISNDTLNAQPLVVLDGSAVGTIRDDDSPPTASLSLAQASVTENGSPNLVFTVTLSQPYGAALTVNFGVGGTATAGTDYAAIGTSVTIPAGATTRAITVNPTGDSTLEPHETVDISLAAGTGYTVGSPASASGTILNDDNPVVNVALAPASVVEDGATSLVYTFTLTQPKATNVSLVYTVTGTATAGIDYAAVPSPLVIPAGSTSGSIVIDPAADTAIEANETVVVTLQNGTGYTRGSALAATGTITNDETATATIAVAPGAVLENGTPNLVYTVTLSPAAAVSTAVNFSVGGSASSGSDYAAVTSPLVIPAGATTRTITINPTGDTTVESDETVIVALAAGTSYVLGSPASASGTISNDDLPALTINDVTLVEGDSGTTSAVFTVSLSTPAPNGQTVGVNYATANGTASGTSDYTPASGTLAFAPGMTSATISVPVRGDVQAEANETFVVNLTAPVNARIADTQGRATITDDDTRTATLALAAPVVQEDGLVALAYTVKLSRPALVATTVRFSVGGTATSGNDYAAVGTSVVIPPGATTASVTLTPAVDYLVEADETVVLTLATGTGYVVGAPANATGTIANDDLPTARLALVPASVAEDSGTALAFAVTLDQAATVDTTVQFALSGSASAGVDYVSPGPFVVPAGQTTSTQAFLPIADSEVESDETIVITLLPGTAYVVGTPDGATATIGNDDVLRASIAISPSQAPEDGATSLVFLVTLSQAALVATTLDFTVGGTATAGSDYAAFGSSVTIAAGDRIGTIAVTPLADGTVEPDETVVLALAPGTGYAVDAPAVATGTIGNADAITLAPVTLPATTVANAYAQPISASGGTAPYTYAVTGGALPAGIALAGSGGLSGTATAGGTFVVTVTATDSLGFSGSGVYTLTVSAPAIVLGPTALPPGIAGVPYSASVVATGGTGPHRYALAAGTLPPGLALATDGTLAGTPMGSGTFNVTIAATDSSSGTGPYTGNQAYVLEVAATLVDAMDDVGAVANGARGGVAIADVLANDILAASAATRATVSLAQLATSNANMDLDPATGTVRIAPGTAAGTYLLGYRICEIAYAPNCDDAVATVTVGAGVVDATDDAGSALAGTASIAVASVLANDRLDSAPASVPGVVLSLVSTSDPGVTLDTGSGAVQVSATAMAGNQLLAYQLCEALNPGNCDQATVTVTVNAAPQAQSRVLDVPADGLVQVDLVEGASGGPFTGATLLALAPANAGTATIHAVGSGTAVRHMLEFLPAAGFSGVATVQFTLANAFAVSPVATLTLQVEPRPDPGLEPDVRGLVDAQVQTTRRFADVQGDNVRRRLEGLHGTRRGDGVLENRLDFALSGQCAQAPRSADEGLRARCAVPPATAAGATGPAETDEPERAYGAWIGGQVRSGRHDGGGSSTGFETDGVSVGFDADLSPVFTLGAALGHGRDDSEVGARGSRAEGRSTSYLAYASYHPGVFFLDGLAGYQQLSFDLRRRLAGDGMVEGTREGSQWFGSLTFGADMPAGSGHATPYARFDWASATLDGYTEYGHPTRALRFGAMDVDARTASLGFRYDFRVDTGWGAITPQFRTEYQYDFDDPQATVLRYADLVDGLAYPVEGARLQRKRLMFGAGTAIDWDDGLGMLLEYRTEAGNDDRHDRSVSINLQKQF